jgi:hypothetical protein
MDLGTPLRGVQEVRAHGWAMVEQCRSNCREQRMEQLPNEVTKQSPMVFILDCGDCFAALAMTHIRASLASRRFPREYIDSDLHSSPARLDYHPHTWRR